MRNPAAAFRPEPGSIPEGPGCYQFRDARGRILYIGKAKSLRSRVSSYFGAPSGLATRTLAMLAVARSVEWILVDSEVDALHLEYTLIQRHRPRYNVVYRDDKSHPYLVLSMGERFPRARVTRGRTAASDRRFGPYAHAYAIRETLDLLLRIFPVRTCTATVFDRAERTGRACLLHHIDRCAGPCIGAVDEQEHRVLVDGMASFLDGDTEPVLRRLDHEMRDAAERMEYEVAARRRDQIDAARRASERQIVVAERPVDIDLIAIHDGELEAVAHVFFVRNGRLVGQKSWGVDKVEPLRRADVLRGFLVTLYEERAEDVPPRVLVQEDPVDLEALEGLLTRLRRQHAGERAARVRISVPRRGPWRALLGTVEENAREGFERSRLRRQQDFDARSRALRELQQAVAADQPPFRIECVDISHLAGTEVVASLVVFEDGLPVTGDYRRFKLRLDANDDYAAMREVMRRRFARRDAAEGDARFADAPELLIVDGGRGQLSAALEGIAQARGDAGVPETQVVALAKRLEEIYLPERSRPVMLTRGGDALYLVQRVRDEAHRFAVTYQRTRRRRALTDTALEAIPGIGPTRRRALLERFGSVTAIRRASIEELAATPGISRTLAAQVAAHTGGDEESA